MYLHANAWNMLTRSHLLMLFEHRLERTFVEGGFGHQYLSIHPGSSWFSSLITMAYDMLRSCLFLGNRLRNPMRVCLGFFSPYSLYPDHISSAERKSTAFLYNQY